MCVCVYYHMTFMYLTLLSKATYDYRTVVERDGNILLWCMKIRIEQVSSIHNC